MLYNVFFFFCQTSKNSTGRLLLAGVYCIIHSKWKKNDYDQSIHSLSHLSKLRSIFGLKTNNNENLKYTTAVPNNTRPQNVFVYHLKLAFRERQSTVSIVFPHALQQKITISLDKQKMARTNLIPRFSLLPVERPWLGLVLCLLESGRLQTNDFGEGHIKCKICLCRAYSTCRWKVQPSLDEKTDLPKFASWANLL